MSKGYRVMQIISLPINFPKSQMSKPIICLFVFFFFLCLPNMGDISQEKTYKENTMVPLQSVFFILTSIFINKHTFEHLWYAMCCTFSFNTIILLYSHYRGKNGLRNDVFYPKLCKLIKLYIISNTYSF